MKSGFRTTLKKKSSITPINHQHRLRNPIFTQKKILACKSRGTKLIYTSNSCIAITLQGMLIINLAL